VQGGSVLKPLVGVDSDGPGDACVTRPLLSSQRAVAVSCGINPYYGDLDPYRMAASAIDEAIRQVVAVGAPPDRIALLDNFSWGATSRPDRMGALVLACQACCDTAIAYQAPFISGKDSLNNEYMVDGESICIPHTLLISSIAVMPDASRVVSMDAKNPGDWIYIVGVTREEMGGSHYLLERGVRAGVAPGVDAPLGRRVFNSVHRAIQQGLVRACHDCSEGGIGVAAAEMAFAGGWGMEIDLEPVPTADPLPDTVAGGQAVSAKPGRAPRLADDAVLFSESNSRLLVEVTPEDAPAFEAALAGAPFARIGEVLDSDEFRVLGSRTPGAPNHARVIVRAPVDRLKQAWKSTLAW
jgi:phosphoribosylformylglycinamidine (FGAM) synthase-like enzyme